MVEHIVRIGRHKSIWIISRKSVQHEIGAKLKNARLCARVPHRIGSAGRRREYRGVDGAFNVIVSAL